MKIKISKAINENYLIEDCLGYSLNDFKSIFDFAKIQSLEQGLILVINTSSYELLSKETQEFISAQGLLQVVVIGRSDKLQINQHLVVPFDSEETFVSSGLLEQHQRKFFILKGSGSFEFHRTAQLFSRRSHHTRLEVNLNKIADNIQQVRSTLSTNTKLMVMVKAFAYGAGGVEMAKWLQHQLVDYLAVAFIDEGIELRQNGVECPIMVMSPGFDDAHLLKKYDLEPEVYDLSQLRQYSSEFELASDPIPVHIMFNTGMNRLGIDKDQLDELADILKSSPQIQIKSLMTHLAAADDPSEIDFTQEQQKIFEYCTDHVKSALGVDPILHSLNSHGIANYSQDQQGMVRLGIGMHGISTNKKLSLQFPSTLKTTITQIRSVTKGETIGYGRMGKAKEDSKIATIPIGYADGYLRDYGNGKAYALLNGKEVRTIGNICMDMTMFDITGVDAELNDEVILFGEQPNINDLANWSRSISYEVLTNISARVQRVYYI